MTMQDPIADMLTRVRNGQSAKKKTVSMPASKIKYAIASVLRDEGYIVDYGFEGEGATKKLNITLKYHKGNPVIATLKRASRPGLRNYKSVNNIPKILGGLGVTVISTSKGVMSDRAARALGLGGEVLCYIS